MRSSARAPARPGGRLTRKPEECDTILVDAIKRSGDGRSAALESLDQTSLSAGELTDYLQRNPAAVVRGRYVSDEAKR